MCVCRHIRRVRTSVHSAGAARPRVANPRRQRSPRIHHHTRNYLRFANTPINTGKVPRHRKRSIIDLTNWSCLCFTSMDQIHAIRFSISVNFECCGGLVRAIELKALLLTQNYLRFTNTPINTGKVPRHRKWSTIDLINWSCLCFTSMDQVTPLGLVYLSALSDQLGCAGCGSTY